MSKFRENTEDNESLFSLELVVEKVYIPNNTACRFPAIAFRLLDFPTIVISHVENELDTVIRRKISLDPHYHIPEQFSELKDRHGNFMVKKGKSCLFKIAADVLKQHLASTPLYVMVIDMFPEVPKLIANSTVPLNSLMDNICTDIAKLGVSVPSVHGDKGLFKLYNLMGKEVGYFVLGFRLLCLGPSLLSHLPASALMQRHGKKIKSVDKMLHKEEEYNETAVELKTTACMTDPIKHDVFLQTVEMENKAVHVEMYDNHQNEKHNKNSETKMKSNTTATQTKKKDRFKEALNVQQKWAEQLEHQVDDDECIINNIVCPPPLFYNSEATPNVQIKRQKDSYINVDLSIDDLSDIESFDGHGINTPSLIMETKENQEYNSQHETRSLRNNLFTTHVLTIEKKKSQRDKSSYIPQARHGEYIQGLQVAPQATAVFPILTALINELSCVQDPQLLLDASNKLQAKGLMQMKAKQKEDGNISKKEKETISPGIVAAVAEALGKKLENSKDNITDVSTNPGKSRMPKTQLKSNTFKTVLKPSKNVSLPKNNPFAFRLTNTQRLRLQKTNPEWLRKVEEEAEKEKQQKQNSKLEHRSVDDMNATTFSDTLTEVRRLAEKELESTAGGDTLRQLASEAEEFNSTRESLDISLEVQKACSGQSKSKVKDSSPKYKPQPEPKSRNRIRQRREDKQNQMRDSSDSDDMGRKKPVPLERQLRNITSPGVPEQDNEDLLSARSDLTSRSRSIEVRLPSAQVDPNDSGDITDTDDDIDIPLPDESLNGDSRAQSVNLPQYMSQEASLPEPITGKVNESLGSGLMDDSSPMESTRYSKNLTDEQNNSRVLTEDSFTRQFHSTDEPELLGLVSDEDNVSGNVSATGGSTRRSMASLRTSQKFPVINPQVSENSPVPSVRRSTTKLDAGALSYLPSVSDSKGQRSPVSRSQGSRSPASRGSPVTSRPGTPSKGNNKSLEFQPLNPKGGIITPRSIKSQRSMSPGGKRITPRLQKKSFTRESIHTESVSSFMPSDPDNLIVSLSSNSGVYSDDFQDSFEANSSVEQLPKIGMWHNKKLGYTIN